MSDTLTSAFYTAARSWHTHPSVAAPALPPQFPPTHQARRISPRYTSHVQIRGSIPLYWTQDAAKALKPPIEMALRDPFYSAAAKHFDSLFRAYGRSCIVLNLIKVRPFADLSVQVCREEVSADSVISAYSTTTTASRHSWTNSRTVLST